MTTLLDKTFRVSIILKGLDGLLELMGGVILLFVSADTINRVIYWATTHELSQDPHDFLANLLRNSSHHLNGSVTFFGALYLLSHGIVKIVLVLALLKEKLWAYPWMIGFLGVFIVYQIYRMFDSFTFSLLLLTLFDIFIVWLTVLEYRKHKQRNVADTET